jgi:ATP-dependent phosphofructokinase / diphosphate-dependent phosphofructokinase
MGRKIGMLTGGGDCPGLNAVIRAAAKTAILEHGCEVIGFEDGFDGLVHNKWRPLTFLDVSGILTEGGTVLGTNNRADPFRYPIEKDDGSVEYQDLSKQAAENFKSTGCDALIVIGGDGTLTIANNLTPLGVPCVGVPKTIDNDVYGTDRTFGFDSAMSCATDALDRLQSTAQAHHRVMVLEVMGRNAGWIALASGVAGGSDIILIPEIPYSMDVITKYLLNRVKAGKRFSIIVVAEGAKPVDGDVVVMRRVADAAEPIRLGGIGFKLQQEIEDATGIETRATILGHLQRGGSPSPLDRVLATRLGHEAANLAMREQYGCMVGLRGTEIVPFPIKELAGKQRCVNPDHHLVHAARSIGTCFGDSCEACPILKLCESGSF